MLLGDRWQHAANNVDSASIVFHCNCSLVPRNEISVFVSVQRQPICQEPTLYISAASCESFQCCGQMKLGNAGELVVADTRQTNYITKWEIHTL